MIRNKDRGLNTMVRSPSLERSRSRTRAIKTTKVLGGIVTENALSLITAIILDPSQAHGYLATASRFQFALYVSFLVLTFLSLPVGFMLSFLSKKDPASDEIISVQHTLSCVAVASVVMAMGAGLCVVLPRGITVIVAVICFIAGNFAYKMNLHVLMLNISSTKEDRNHRKANEAAQKMARKVILSASTLISAMVLSPCDIMDYVTTMSNFAFYLAIIFAMLTFISLVLGFLLLLLANKDGKSDEMMLKQKGLRVAAAMFMLLVMATGLGLIVREFLIGVGIICFIAFVFRQQMNLSILI